LALIRVGVMCLEVEVWWLGAFAQKLRHFSCYSPLIRRAA